MGGCGEVRIGYRVGVALCLSGSAKSIIHWCLHSASALVMEHSDSASSGGATKQRTHSVRPSMHARVSGVIHSIFASPHCWTTARIASLHCPQEVQCALCHKMRALEHGWLGARSARPPSTLTGEADGLSADGASLDEEAVTSLGDDGSILLQNRFHFRETARQKSKEKYSRAPHSSVTTDQHITKRKLRHGHWILRPSRTSPHHTLH